MILFDRYYVKLALASLLFLQPARYMCSLFKAEKFMFIRMCKFCFLMIMDTIYSIPHIYFSNLFKKRMNNRAKITLNIVIFTYVIRSYYNSNITQVQLFQTIPAAVLHLLYIFLHCYFWILIMFLLYIFLAFLVCWQDDCLNI